MTKNCYLGLALVTKLNELEAKGQKPVTTPRPAKSPLVGVLQQLDEAKEIAR